MNVGLIRRVPPGGGQCGYLGFAQQLAGVPRLRDKGELLQSGEVGVPFALVSSVSIRSGSVPRPGFFRVLWELVVGYVFTLIALLLPLLGLVYMGVFDWNAPGFRAWPLRGPYPPDGVWAISADLFCATVVIGLATVLTAGSMEAGLKLPVSRPIVAVVVTVTGVVPFFYAQLLPASGPVSLLVATFLIRRSAIDRFEPRKLRFSRWLLAAALALVFGLVATVSFGVTHPLWAKDAYLDQERHVYFTLHNAGLAKVKIVSFSELAELTFPLTPAHQRPPVAGAVVPAHQSRSITLLKSGCPPDDLSVRYRVFGRTMSVRLRPDLPSFAHC